VVELVVENKPKKEALKDKTSTPWPHASIPNLPRRFAKNKAALEAAAQKGNPKATLLGILACINDIASPWDLLATCCCGRSFTWQQQRVRKQRCQLDRQNIRRSNMRAAHTKTT
jgi:hypothetical protein